MSIEEKEQRTQELLQAFKDLPFSRRQFLEKSGAGFGLLQEASIVEPQK
jgi:hypothetical protein